MKNVYLFTYFSSAIIEFGPEGKFVLKTSLRLLRCYFTHIGYKLILNRNAATTQLENAKYVSPINRKL